MRFAFISFAVVCLSSSCALRPRYAEFVTSKTEGKEVTFLVSNAFTRLPVANAKVEIGELRNRIVTTTGPDGTFTLPVDRKYVDENPVFVVTLPKGVLEYRLALAPPPAPLQPEPVPAEVPVEAPVVTDAGIPSSP